jgi:lysophospholipase L1-like esterase
MMPRRTAGSTRYRSARALLLRGGALTALLTAGFLVAGYASASATPARAPASSAAARAATAQAAHSGRTGRRPAYYVALGDSLAQGVQPATPPLPAGVKLGQSIETNQGYANDLYAHYKREFPGTLKLMKLGCPGETTTSMLTGTGSPCTYPHQRSQLAAALAFISTHRAEVKLVTIDIGANNIDDCATGTTINTACLSKGIAAAQHDLPLILRALRQAAGPRTKIAGMNLYDPFLAEYLTGAAGQSLATESVTLGVSYNKMLRTSFRAFAVRTANVQDAFSTTDFTDTAPLPGAGTVPLNVARICEWTWMCAPSPVGPNIHANATGYQVITSAFERVIGRLVPLGR